MIKNIIFLIIVLFLVSCAEVATDLEQQKDAEPKRDKTGIILSEGDLNVRNIKIVTGDYNKYGYACVGELVGVHAVTGEGVAPFSSKPEYSGKILENGVIIADHEKMIEDHEGWSDWFEKSFYGAEPSDGDAYDLRVNNPYRTDNLMPQNWEDRNDLNPPLLAFAPTKPGNNEYVVSITYTPSNKEVFRYKFNLEVKEPSSLSEKDVEVYAKNELTSIRDDDKNLYVNITNRGPCMVEGNISVITPPGYYENEQKLATVYARKEYFKVWPGYSAPVRVCTLKGKRIEKFFRDTPTCFTSWFEEDTLQVKVQPFYTTYYFDMDFSTGGPVTYKDLRKDEKKVFLSPIIVDKFKWT